MEIKIKVGEHDVAIRVEDVGATYATCNLSGSVLRFTASAGDTKMSNTMGLHPKHDRTADQLQKDIQAHAQLLAEETAGHEQSRVLISSLLKG